MNMEGTEEGPRIGDTGTFCESSFQPWIHHQQCRTQRHAAGRCVTLGDFLDSQSPRTMVGIRLSVGIELNHLGQSEICTHLSRCLQMFVWSHYSCTLRRDEVFG